MRICEHTFTRERCCKHYVYYGLFDQVKLTFISHILDMPSTSLHYVNRFGRFYLYFGEKNQSCENYYRSILSGIWFRLPLITYRLILSPQ